MKIDKTMTLRAGSGYKTKIIPPTNACSSIYSNGTYMFDIVLTAMNSEEEGDMAVFLV